MRNRLDDKLYAYGLLVRAGQLGEGLHSGECEQRPSLPLVGWHPAGAETVGSGTARLKPQPGSGEKGQQKGAHTWSSMESRRQQLRRPLRRQSCWGPQVSNCGEADPAGKEQAK